MRKGKLLHKELEFEKKQLQIKHTLSTQKEIYKKVVEKYKDNIPMFYQTWWLDIVSDTYSWDACIAEDKGGNVIGIMPYFRNSLKFIPILSNPILSPYQGIWIFYPSNQSSKTSKYSFENKTIDKLLKQLPTDVYYSTFNFHHRFSNWQIFSWQGYKQTTRYTYILEDIFDHEALWSGCSNTLKRQIKSASDEFIIEENDDVSKLYELFEKSMKKAGTRHGISFQGLEKLYWGAKERQQGSIIHAMDKNNISQAAMFLVWDSEYAYAILIGKNDQEKNDAIKYLLWESIKYASSFVRKYDFEGSMVQNVDRVFRSFGGTRTAYHRIYRYKNRLIQSIFALFNK